MSGVAAETRMDLPELRQWKQPRRSWPSKRDSGCVPKASIVVSKMRSGLVKKSAVRETVLGYANKYRTEDIENRNQHSHQYQLIAQPVPKVL